MTLWWAGCGETCDETTYAVDAIGLPSEFWGLSAIDQFWAITSSTYRPFFDEEDSRAYMQGEDCITWSIWVESDARPTWFQSNEQLAGASPRGVSEQFIYPAPGGSVESLSRMDDRMQIRVSGRWTWTFFESVDAPSFPEGWDELDNFDKSLCWGNLGGNDILQAVFSEFKHTTGTQVTELGEWRW